jgi:hypothetical protein
VLDGEFSLVPLLARAEICLYFVRPLVLVWAIVYSPIANWVLALDGVDFAGRTSVHISSGTAGLSKAARVRHRTPYVGNALSASLMPVSSPIWRLSYYTGCSGFVPFLFPFSFSRRELINSFPVRHDCRLATSWSVVGFYRWPRSDHPSLWFCRRTPVPLRQPGHISLFLLIAFLCSRRRCYLQFWHFTQMSLRIRQSLDVHPHLGMVEEAAGTRMFEERKDKAQHTMGKKEKRVLSV